MKTHSLYSAIAIALAFHLAGTVGLAQGTLVGGTIANQTWTKDKSPYLVTNDVYVSGSLLIREGVEIRMVSNVVFEVGGRVRASGTADEPVLFQPADPQVGWQGLLFRDAVPGSTFRHVVIAGSKNSGVRIGSTPPAFTNCWIRGNTSPNGGGGVSASAVTADLIFHGCVVSDNSSGDRGGGIYAVLEGKKLSLLQCTVSGNTSASHGGGVWADAGGGEITVIDGTISGNQANAPGGLLNGEGGGLNLRGQIQILRCSITENVCYARCDGTFGCAAAGYGGGAMLYGNTLVQNARIQGNRVDAADWSGWPFYGEAYGYGAGIAHWAGTLSARNALFVSNAIVVSGNATYPRGGGIAIGGGGQVSAEIANSTFYKNDSFGVYNHDAKAVIRNSILYFNNAGGEQLAGQATVTFSDVQHGVPGEGNVAFNPSLCPDNWSLLAGSPCIDAGDPGLESRDGLTSELGCSLFARGTARNDMGAYGGPWVVGWTEPYAQPVIRIQPDNALVLEGTAAVIAVLATGLEPLNFQWFRNNTLSAGLTTPVIRVDAATLAEAGTYRVEASNALGQTVSTDVRLMITQLQVAAILEGDRVWLTIRKNKPFAQCKVWGASSPAGMWTELATIDLPGTETRWPVPGPVTGAPRFFYCEAVGN